MKSLAKSFLVCGVILLSAVSSVADDTKRQMMSVAEQSKWPAIGRLSIIGHGFCTATLIAPDMVLTAAHCVVDKRTQQPVAPKSLHFLAGYRAGTYVAHGQGAEIFLMPGYTRTKQYLGADIATIRLTKPMPTEIEPLSAGGILEPSLTLSSLSYGLDRAQIPSIERDCHVIDRKGTVIYTDCDGVPGVSGAPIIQMTPSGPVVVAVASALTTTKTSPMPQGAVMAVAAGATQMDILTSPHQ